MSDESKPPFRLLQGGALVTEAPRDQRSPGLKLVRVRDVPAVQLGFPFVRIASNTVVSVGYEGLTQEALEALLSGYLPSALVDIRVSPSFNSYRLSRERVARALKEHHVRYLRFHGLANRFVGDSLDFRETLERYAEWIRQRSQLFELRSLIDRGPVLLLSGLSSHELSDRSVLVDELQRRWPSFEVVVPA